MQFKGLFNGPICVDTTHQNSSSLYNRKLLLESDAKAFRDSLIRLAKGGTASWRFGREKGEPVSSLLSTQQEWILLVIGHRIIGRQSGRVVTLLPQGESASRTRSLSRNLSQVLNTAVLELDWRLRENELLTTISATSAAVVVIDAASESSRGQDRIRKLLEAARCPVLIVRTASAEDPLK